MAWNLMMARSNALELAAAGMRTGALVVEGDAAVRGCGVPLAVADVCGAE